MTPNQQQTKQQERMDEILKEQAALNYLKPIGKVRTNDQSEH